MSIGNWNDFTFTLWNSISLSNEHNVHLVSLSADWYKMSESLHTAKKIGFSLNYETIEKPITDGTNFWSPKEASNYKINLDFMETI